MSDTDSFIEEVNEELQRDQLAALLKKYGWIAALLVILLVGGAAFNEYRKASARSQSEALGDQILTALEAEDRATALAQLPDEEGGVSGIIALIRAADTVTGAARDTAIAQLEALSVAGDVDPVYRELATLKLVILQGADAPAQARIERLDAISTPGAPFRILAQEHKALVLAESGQSKEALEVLTQLLDDAEATEGLRQRVTQMIVALGGEV